MKSRPASVDDLSLDELRGLVGEPLARVSALEEENAALKDEVARLKGLKGRPKLKPPGTEKATSRTKARSDRKKTKRKHGRRSPEVIDELDGHPQETFADRDAWLAHLYQPGISQLPHAGSGVHPLNATVVPRSAVKIATEGALFGSIRAHELLQGTVIISDGPPASPATCSSP